MTSVTVTLVSVRCASCGVIFGLPDFLNDKRKEDGDSFYCPNGHVLTYGKSEADKQRDRAGRLAAQLDQAEAERAAEQRAHAATKGKLTKTRNRLSGGVCPCCNRTFVKLGQHMKTKHPEFGGTL